MVNIDNYTKSSGMFLKAQDVIDNPTTQFVVKEEGQMVANEKYGGERLHLQGMFGEEERTFDCSKTNARFISEKLSTDTATWIGATLTLETYRTKTSDGKMVDALNVKDATK